MKILRNSFIIFFLSITLILPAQNGRLEHKIVAGFNLGATTPLPIPEEVRGVDGWWPQFTPQLGYNITYLHSEKWGIGSGILLDYKGMGARDRVKYMYTSVVLESENDSKMKGYFTGKNETKVKSSYVTFPIYAVYRPNQNWDFKLGGYLSYRFSSEFKGTVWDGYLRVVENKGDPLSGEKVIIREKNDATFNFGDEMQNFDCGLLIGAERRINERFGITGNLSWGLTPVFPSSFETLSFKMRNIYLMVGMTYSL